LNVPGRSNQLGEVSDHNQTREVLRNIVGALTDDDAAPADEVAEAPVEPRPVLAAPIQTDAERYQGATGRSLPAVHGLIVVPPATPGGDATYIWPTEGSN
jgi:hypothetical protein